jgi:peptidyl-prolyl cis-trans isomerase A (cyclophilin A)
MIRRNLWIQILAVLFALSLTVLASGQAKKGQTAAASVKHPIVLMETTMGTIKVEVFPDKAPVTAKNFLDYVTSGFYDGTIFHRVDPTFVIQGGGYLENMAPKQTRLPIKNESKNGLKNLRGTLSMARYDDPDSATSQFFINLKDNSNLDPANSAGGWGYAVFAKVVEGMDVVDKIAAVKTGTKNVFGTAFANFPLQPVVLKSAKVLQ